MTNANRKGKDYERHIAKTINDKLDSHCRRTPNSGGLSIKGDIIDTQGVMSRFHVECKKQERANVWKFMEQSRNDSGRRIPLVVMSKNHEDDYVFIELDDFLNLVLEIQELKNENQTSATGEDN
jgi:hypothetical protein